MKKIEFEDLWPHINCIIPHYDETGGNVTKVYLDDGTVLVDPRKVNTVIKSLADFFTVGLESSRKKYSKVIGRKLTVPIPLHQDLVLVPVKTRRPIAREDGAYGYVVLSKVQVYNTHPRLPNSIEITFGDGTTIDGLILKQSFEKLLLNAKKVHKEYTRLFLVSVNNQNNTLKEEMCEYYVYEYIKQKILQKYLHENQKKSAMPGF